MGFLFLIFHKDKLSTVPEPIEIQSTFTGSKINDYTLSTFEYDSCEYLLNIYPGGRSITHKGNCKYCEARLHKNRAVSNRHINSRIDVNGE